MATDSYKFEMTGLTSFLIGAVGVDGAMGSTLIPYIVKDATATFNIAEPTQTDINIYQSDTAYAVLNGKQPKDFSLELFGLKLSDLPTFMGGSYVASAGATPDRWDAPTTIPVITKSVKLQSKDSLGNVIGLVFPKCQLVASVNGSLSKDDLLGLKLKVVVLAPVNGSGDVLSSWGIDGEAAGA